MNPPPSRKRWYDRQPRLAEAVRILSHLPDEVTNVLSEGVVVIANRDFNIGNALHDVKSLGMEKIMGLHKSKNKKRLYDQNPTLHKAMNYLYILENDNQDVMADHILTLMTFIQEYLSTCKIFQADASQDDIAKITKIYVEQGGPEVRRFLDSLREKLHELILLQDQEKPVDFLEDIMGTKIKGNSQTI
ncbi:MAG: hypothetical protein AB7P76_10825 [Candidatus Melainabacteria bacterium]